MNDSFYTLDFILACRLGFFVPGFSWPEGELIQWPVLMIDADADIEYALASHREVDGLMTKIDDFEEKIAHLEDLRRWRPMTEPPGGEGFFCARPGKNPWVECWVWKDGHWNHRGASYATENLSGWEWTYIPGQEPKESQ